MPQFRVLVSTEEEVELNRYRWKGREVVGEVEVSKEDPSQYLVRILCVDGVSNLTEAKIDQLVTKAELAQIDTALCEAMREEEALVSRCYQNDQEMRAAIQREPGRYPATEKYAAGVMK